MNTIIATIPFSFRGEDHTPSIRIDLDNFAKKDMDVSFLFHTIATANKIDTYSYQYEVLESSRIIFSQATGIAIEFLNDDEFDFDGFKTVATQSDIEAILNQIVQSTLPMNSLNETVIQNALLQAFNAGRKYQQS